MSTYVIKKSNRDSSEMRNLTYILYDFNLNNNWYLLCSSPGYQVSVKSSVVSRPATVDEGYMTQRQTKLNWISQL